MSLDTLREKCPWPTERPDVVPNIYPCWFSVTTRRILDALLPKDAKVIVELGSWLGVSARNISDIRPNATVICVDTWQGTGEEVGEYSYLFPILFETFCVNNWDYKDKLIPVRRTTLDGMDLIASEGIKVDAFYIDAAHDYESVLNDIHKAVTLFPNAFIMGDDWYHPDVQKAVLQCATEYNFGYGWISGAWHYVKS